MACQDLLPFKPALSLPSRTIFLAQTESISTIVEPGVTDLSHMQRRIASLAAGTGSFHPSDSRHPLGAAGMNYGRGQHELYIMFDWQLPD